jgi:flagellin
MTRINTNVSSLVAQNILGRSNSALEQALNRLSTGLRINSGKDDPAGLIASENLRSDITAIRRAVSNTERADQVIATADGSLGEVSKLLNDIRGLVTESANAGALSDEQIAANQLQVDSSLEALNRIAQTTTFQGRRLLDGSLDFITSAGANFSNLSNLQIDQANLGAAGQVSVDVNVATAATQATVTVDNLPDVTPTVTASVDFDIVTTAAVGSSATGVAFTAITADTVQSVSTVTLGGANTDTITITAVEDGSADGAVAYTIVVNDNAGTPNGATATYNETTDVLTINADISGGVGSDDVAAAIQAALDTQGDQVFTASSDGTDNLIAADEATIEGIAVGNVTVGVNATTTAVTIDIEALASEGTNGDIDIDFVEAALGGGSPEVVVIGNATSGYTVQLNTDNAGPITIEDIETALETINEIDSVTITAGAGAVFNAFDVASINELPAATVSLAGGVDEVVTTETIDLTTAVGETGNIDIDFAEANLSGAGTNIVDNGVVGGAQSYTLQIDNTVGVTIGTIRAALEALDEIGTAAIASGSPGTSTYNAAADAPPATVNIVGAGASTQTNGIDEDLVFQLSGDTGAEVLSFGAGTSLQLLIDGINAVSDATGVTAAANSTDDGIIFTSSNYGSNAFVDIAIISEASTGAFTAELGQGSRTVGTDVVASVNGITANGDGNRLSINTATLDLSTTVEAGFVGTASFTITGGGALFQLGPDVVSNQQARLGITSVNTAALGGVSGLLYQLGSGESADLSSDPTTAAQIVDEAINQVTSLRGRLGAFQRTMLETNRNALTETLTNLTAAESSIRDADFAAETAALTRAQILVQSGTAVLAIANQNPQNVLGLLR